MHIGRHIVQELVLEFGEPTIERWEAPLTETEFRNIVRHREHGRAHDVSLLILKAGDAAVIRKAGYPEGAFRIPSGGVHPEESFVDGALREAYEETGLSVAIKDYLLQIHATFTLGDERAPWTTHVMLARPLGGAAETLMDFAELVDEVSPLLEESGLGGLRYRARIHRRLSELDERIGMRAAAS